MVTINIEKENVKMIAHRGLSGLEKENTMAAFIAAGNRSYYGIECDIHKTLDGQFVVIHDDNTKRVAPIDKIIKESNYDELKEITLYGVKTCITENHLRIPLLSEYIEACKKYNKKCIIEFKDIFEKDDIMKVMDIVSGYQYMSNTIFISFVLENLITIRKVDKQVEIQYLTSIYDNKTLMTLRKYHFGIDINRKALTKDIVDELHKYHLEVNVWTVDNPIEALVFVSWGVDYITTNILE